MCICIVVFYFLLIFVGLELLVDEFWFLCYLKFKLFNLVFNFNCINLRLKFRVEF